MASQHLERQLQRIRHQIASLQARAKWLESLAENPPVLPSGFKVAVIVNTDWTAMKYDEGLPDYGTFVVVPDQFPDEVTVVGEYRGNRITLDDGRVWLISSWGECPEEAIAEFLGEPGDWA